MFIKRHAMHDIIISMLALTFPPGQRSIQPWLHALSSHWVRSGGAWSTIVDTADGLKERQYMHAVNSMREVRGREGERVRVRE